MNNKFDIFMQWLRELGGEYTFLRDDTPTKPHEPEEKPTLRPINPRKYYTDNKGCVRRRV